MFQSFPAVRSLVQICIAPFAVAFANFYDWLCRLWDQQRTWQAAWIAGVTAYLTALFVSFPGTLLHRYPYHIRMKDTLKLSQNLFARDLDEGITAYRLTVPVLAKLLHISSPAVMTVLFQVIPSIATLALLFVMAGRCLGPRKAWPITLMFALSFLLFWTFYYGGLFDPITHLCLVAVMFTKNPALALGVAFAGVMNDERFIISAPFALLWHYKGGGFRDLCAQTFRPAMGVVLGVSAALCLRHALTVGLLGPGISKPDVYRRIWEESIMLMRPYETQGFLIGWSLFAVNLMMSFRWVWLVFLAFFCGKDERYFAGFKASLILAVLLAILSSAVVMDVAKSIGFLFPAVFFGVVARQSVPAGGLSVLWKTVIALMLTPVFCINGRFPAFWLPLPVEGLRLLAMSVWNYDVMRDFILPLVHSEKVFPPMDMYRR